MGLFLSRSLLLWSPTVQIEDKLLVPLLLPAKPVSDDDRALTSLNCATLALAIPPSVWHTIKFDQCPKLADRLERSQGQKITIPHDDGVAWRSTGDQFRDLTPLLRNLQRNPPSLSDLAVCTCSIYCMPTPVEALAFFLSRVV